MNRSKVRYVHDGKYGAEVRVDLIEDATGWGPCLSVEDSCRLDEARQALKRGDVEEAAHYGRVYEMHRVAGD